MTPQARLTQLREQHKTLKAYLLTRFENADWHGVMDAAADLRDVECEMKGIELGMGASSTTVDKMPTAFERIWHLVHSELECVRVGPGLYEEVLTWFRPVRRRDGMQRIVLDGVRIQPDKTLDPHACRLDLREPTERPPREDGVFTDFIDAEALSRVLRRRKDELIRVYVSPELYGDLAELLGDSEPESLHGIAIQVDSDLVERQRVYVTENAGLVRG